MSLHYKLFHCGDNWPIIQRIGTKPITHDKKKKNQKNETELGAS